MCQRTFLMDWGTVSAILLGMANSNPREGHTPRHDKQSQVQSKTVRLPPERPCTVSAVIRGGTGISTTIGRGKKPHVPVWSGLQLMETAHRSREACAE